MDHDVDLSWALQSREGPCADATISGAAVGLGQKCWLRDLGRLGSRAIPTGVLVPALKYRVWSLRNKKAHGPLRFSEGGSAEKGATITVLEGSAERLVLQRSERRLDGAASNRDTRLLCRDP